MAAVIWSGDARQSLYSALAPLYRDSELIGEKWLNKIYAATDRLARFPESGGPVEEVGFIVGAVIRAERDLHRAISPDELP